MDKIRECGCKGCRTCLLCEEKYSVVPNSRTFDKNSTYVYCPYCEKAYLGWDLDEYKTHPNHSSESIDYPGIYIDLDFLNESEESSLLKSIEEIPWDLSQSGRRKQNYGPKCNFKKRRIRLGEFNGFPACFRHLQDKFQSVDILKDFQTIEQCTLEYDPKRGASIDPHVDDCWIWGERIVTVNLLSDSVLTMTWNRYPERYNLDFVEESWSNCDREQEEIKNCVVRIPMPARSLLVIYGSARYNWEHEVLREDIQSRRVCLAYREFTPPYLKDGKSYKEVEEIYVKAKHFF